MDALTLLDNLRTKYPEYADIPDAELSSRIVAKYPEYRDVLEPAGPVGQVRAEPSFLESIGQSAQRIAPEILPLIGLFGGGLLGGTAGAAGGPLAPATVPGGAAIGAGLGYASGQQANRAVGSLMDLVLGRKQADYGTPLEQAGTIGKDVLTGGAIEAGGQVFMRGLGALGEILRDAGVPGFGPRLGDPVLAAAERAGIELPAGAATQSRALSAIEATPGRFPFGAQPAREFFDRTALSAQRAGERLASTAGPPTSLEAAGHAIQRDVSSLAGAQERAAADMLTAQEQHTAREISNFLSQFGRAEELGPAGLATPQRTSLGAEIQAALDAAQTEARGQIAPLYAALRNEVSGAGSAVPMTTTKEVADRILELEARMSGLGRSGVSRPAGAAGDLSSPTLPPEVHQLPTTMQESVIRQLGLDQGRAIEPDIALELSKRLAAASRNAPDDVTRRALQELRTAVEQDLGAWASVSGTNVGPLRQEAAQAYREQIVPFFSEQAPLRRQLMDVEPEVAGQRLLAARDPQLIQDAMRFLPPEVQQRVRASILGGVPRDLAGFESAVGKIGDDTLGALLGPEQAMRLQELRAQLQANQGLLERRTTSMFGPGTADPQLAAIANQTGSVEGLVNSLTKGRYKSLEDFDAVWQTISPEAQRQVRAASLGRILEESLDPVTGTFSPQRFVSRTQDVPPIVWQRMLLTDQRGAMADMVTTLQRFNDYARGAANPSETGRTILGIGQLTGLANLGWQTLTGQIDPMSFAGQLAVLTSPQWGGKMLFSRPVQNFLMRPPTGGPSSVDPIVRYLGLQLSPGQTP